MNKGRTGNLLEASNLLDILDVFGEDGLRMYLVGILEGRKDVADDEADDNTPLEDNE